MILNSKRRWRLLSVALVLGALVGCSQPDDGLTKEQRGQGDRLTEIAGRTNGDWSVATEEDKRFLLDMSFGSETSAKMLLANRARQAPQSAGGGPKIGSPDAGD